MQVHRLYKLLFFTLVAVLLLGAAVLFLKPGFDTDAIEERTDTIRRARNLPSEEVLREKARLEAEQRQDYERLREEAARPGGLR